MSLNLNLLPSQAKFQAERTRIVTLVKKIVGGIAGIWVLGLVIVLGWWWYQNSETTKAELKYSQVSAGFKPELAKIAKGQELRSRLQFVKGVLATRFEYGSAFKKMSELFGPEVEVDNFKLAEKGQFIVNAKAANTKVMNIVENRVLEINSGKSPTFASMKLTGVTWEKGVWLIGLIVDLRNGE